MQTLTLHIPADHPSFAGHFPGMPITPGVVLLDLTLVAIANHLQRELSQCRLNSVKFLRPVMPDTALVIHYETNAAGNIQFDIKDAEHVAVSGVFHA